MNQVISFLVTNRLFTSIFFIVVLLVGWAKLPDLKVSQYPKVDIPMLTINVLLPGASSRAIESQVDNRIEEEIDGIQSVREVSSRITNSSARMVVEFERNCW